MRDGEFSILQNSHLCEFMVWLIISCYAHTCSNKQTKLNARGICREILQYSASHKSSLLHLDSKLKPFPIGYNVNILDS